MIPRRRLIASGLALYAVGFVLGGMQAHIKPTGWGWVWELEPRLVRCPDGSMTLPPWHVLVLYDYQAPILAFLQERGE
jgi:hypothetical protein